MARTTVMKLWTAFVTAFLALCTALGLVTTTAAAAVPQSDSTRNSGTGTGTTASAPVTTPATSPWLSSHARSLPPTMKQRIRAEAHGASPTCRHRLLTDPVPATADCAAGTDESPAEPGEPDEPVAPPLQR
ncbi:DUF6344 domain-containing protein [Streptomyces pharetrae]|uniref:DUF6344 domain-containing protein n=1 Tax=Streptomyces pharetrae TaxID=291370 RepID=UPI00335D7E2C